MRRTFNFLLLFFLSVMTVMAAPGDLQEKLAALKGISGIEKLQSDYYPEKYVVRITQQVDPKDPAAGTFQRMLHVALSTILTCIPASSGLLEVVMTKSP